MRRFFALGKFTLAAAAIAAPLAFAGPAAAQPFRWGPNPEWGYRYLGRPWPAPVVRYGYYAGPRCFVRRHWVWGPFGRHLVVRRFCRY